MDDQENIIQTSEQEDVESEVSDFPVYSRRDLMRMTHAEQQNLAVHIYGEDDPETDTKLVIARILTFQLWQTSNVTLDVNGSFFKQEVMIRYYWMMYHTIDARFPAGDDQRYLPDPPFGINLCGLILSACPNSMPGDDQWPNNGSLIEFIITLDSSVNFSSAMETAENYHNSSDQSATGHKAGGMLISELLELNQEPRGVEIVEKRTCRVKNVFRKMKTPYVGRTEEMEKIAPAGSDDASKPRLKKTKRQKKEQEPEQVQEQTLEQEQQQKDEKKRIKYQEKYVSDEFPKKPPAAHFNEGVDKILERELELEGGRVKRATNTPKTFSGLGDFVDPATVSFAANPRKKTSKVKQVNVPKSSKKATKEVVDLTKKRATKTSKKRTLEETSWVDESPKQRLEVNEEMDEYEHGHGFEEEKNIEPSENKDDIEDEKQDVNENEGESEHENENKKVNVNENVNKNVNENENEEVNVEVNDNNMNINEDNNNEDFSWLC